MLRTSRTNAVDFLKLRVVDLIAKGVLNSRQVSAVAVRRELNAIGETGFQVVHEVPRCTGIAGANVPAGNQLRVRVNGGPSPNVTPAFARVIVAEVLLFAANEGPNLIALDALAREVAESAVLILGAHAAQISQELHDRRAMDASHARHGTQGVAFNQGGNDAGAFFGGELVHRSKDAGYA